MAPAVWQVRWSEKDSCGARVQRKRVIGTVERYPNEAAVRSAVAVRGTERVLALPAIAGWLRISGMKRVRIFGTDKSIGWHTFRHTYSTLLRSVGTDFKVMQELLRHSTLRSTLDVYTQAITPAKHAAQAAVLSLVFSGEANGRLQSPSSADVVA